MEQGTSQTEDFTTYLKIVEVWAKVRLDFFRRYSQQRPMEIV